jgi:hypothetical protein
MTPQRWREIEDLDHAALGRVNAVSLSDQIDPENVATRRAVERREAGMLIGGIVD